MKISVKDRYPLLIFVLCAFIVLTICMTGLFVKRIETSVSETTEEFVCMLNRKSGELIKGVVADTYLYLNSVSAALESVDAADISGQMAVMEKQRISSGFSQLVLADISGNAVTTDGRRLQVDDKAYFQQVMQGETAVSAVIDSPLNHEKIMVFAVPFCRNGSICGVVAGFHNQDSLGQCFAPEILNDGGTCFIMDRDGNLLLESTGFCLYFAEGNLYSFLKRDYPNEEERLSSEAREILENGLEGSFILKGSSGPNYIGYCPLGFDDLTLLTLYSGSIVTGHTRTLRLCLIGIIVFDVVVVLLLILYGLVQVQHQKDLIKIAYDDEITGGGNEAWFIKNAGDRLLHSPDGEYYFCVVNIDRFKVYNDEFGFDRGNQLLKRVYDELARNLQKGEYVARTNADQFCLLVHNTGEKELEHRFIEFVYTINDDVQSSGSKYFLAFRVGGYHIFDNATEYHNALGRAIMASTKGRKTCNGLLRIGFFSERSRKVLLEEKNLENAMDAALKNGEFKVYYQPKYALKSDMVAAAEALVRWDSPEYGFLSPDHFVPLFERNGFIRRVDIYVFEQVCKMLRSWQDDGIEPVVISVNLSRTYIDDCSFLDIYMDLIMKYEIDPSLIELELTETAVYDDMEKLLTLIEDIHRIGFSISLDDFGSGYSSLNMLKDIPVDVLKLDKGFFDTDSCELDFSSQKAGKIVQTVLELAKKLDMKTVAEGVETDVQVSFLRDTFCDMVQGYAFSKPLNPEEFDSLLRVQSARKNAESELS